jgi:two-component system, OmpR family, sensor histidine kinase QseC
MKLLNKISIWFIGIILLITPVTMYISRNNIKRSIDTAEVERLQSVNRQVAEQLKSGNKPESIMQERKIEISLWPGPLPATNSEVVRDCNEKPGLQRNECLISVNSWVQLNGKVFKISTYNYVTKTDLILNGMMAVLFWKMLAITIVVFVTASLLSRRIFKPFRQAMEAIHHFSLRQKAAINLAPTSTKEFKELNEFLKKMTDKAVEEYASIKEFSENASHELQTPLAVMQSKVELLAETDINGTQAALIEDMQNAIVKLSQINRSLILLTRLENQEFKTEKDILFCTITREALAAFADRISLKNITVTSKLDKEVPVTIHPVLAEILVNNLLNNAIRHNIDEGRIVINLSRNVMQISNTGLPPEIPTEELFQRFKKSNQSADSIGLGLAIAKQICEVSHFSIFYHYQDGWHTIALHFDKNATSSLQPLPVYQAAETEMMTLALQP